MPSKNVAISLLMVTVSILSFDQSFGQTGAFSFLELPMHSRIAGLGGRNISTYDQDPGFVTSNPGLIGPNLSSSLGLNFVHFPGDISVSNVAMVTQIGSSGLWGSNISYVNYGELNGYDAAGISTGDFVASDIAITISKPHQIGNFNFGLNLNYAQSRIAGQSASAVLLDVGGSFIHPDKDFVASLVMRNLGVVLSDFGENADSNLPFDVLLGTSFKPLHMPVRFSLTLYNLDDWSKINESQSDASGVEVPGTLDQIFRHTIWGLDLLIGRHVEFLFGYDHKIRQELKSSIGAGGAGFSYGLIVKVKSFEFGFGRRTYHVSGASNTFTVNTKLSELLGTRNISD